VRVTLSRNATNSLVSVGDPGGLFLLCAVEPCVCGGAPDACVGGGLRDPHTGGESSHEAIL
jgi:hypothetical protein